MRKILIALSVLLIAGGFWGSACWAKEPATPQLSLNEAIDLAIKNSKSIKRSALDVEKNEARRDDAKDNANYAPAPGGAPNPQAEAAWYSLLSADLTWQMSKKSLGVEEDRLVLSVCQKYWNVQKSLESVQSKELSVLLAELSQRRVQAMIRLGMTPPEYSSMSPQAALTAAEEALAKAKSDLTSAQNKLKSDYEALNQLLGLWPEDRPQLVEEVNFEPLAADTDLENHVQRIIETSPSIWLAEEKINLAKYAYEMMWASGQYTSYDVRKVEKEQAELDAVTAKDATRLATRGLYYTVRNLEAGIPAAENALAGAEEALRVAKLQFELGMITKENLLRAEAQLAQAKQVLIDLKQQHAYAKLAFQKPWAVSVKTDA